MSIYPKVSDIPCSYCQVGWCMIGKKPDGTIVQKSCRAGCTKLELWWKDEGKSMVDKMVKDAFSGLKLDIGV